MKSMAKNFEILRAKLTPEARARSRSLAQKYRAEMALDELRVAHAMTQKNLAEILDMNQASLSKMERQTDMYISTLSSIIRAMGGYLKLEAIFPDGRVMINQFSDLKESEGPLEAETRSGRKAKPPRSMAGTAHK
jgi:DNA-binding XRE family transcriptional regulator